MRTLAGMLIILMTTLTASADEPARGRQVRRDPAAVAADIDREVERRLADAKVAASPLADDAEFLRRVFLDLTGRIPTLERTTAFLDSKDPDKRSKLIDELLARQEYGLHFATLWRNRIAPGNSTKGKYQPDKFSPWLAEQFNRNRGWDQIVAELLTVEGDIAQKPQSAFIMANSEGSRPQANLLAASAARFFLGVQLRCAECHDHPFAPWKQTDFWATAAFFSRLRNTGKKGPPFALTETPDPDPLPKSKVEDPTPQRGPGASIVIPASVGKGAGRIVKARFFGGEEPALGDAGPLRPAFAAWVTSPENKLFAPAAVNRLWAHLFARGFINPVDDWREDQPVSHPDLLKLLADEFRAAQFDVKHLLRCICNSRAYQRTSRPSAGNESDHELFSHMALKVLSPEAFYDSLTVVMGADKLAAPANKGKPGKDSTPTPNAKGGNPKSSPRETRDDFIQFFRAQGDLSEDHTTFSHGIPQFLKRLNGDLFNSGAPIVDRLARPETSRGQAIASLYLATLSRRPTPEETELMEGYVSKQSEPARAYAGVLWILLNSGEFVMNH